MSEYTAWLAHKRRMVARGHVVRDVNNKPIIDRAACRQQYALTLKEAFNQLAARYERQLRELHSYEQQTRTKIE